MELERKRGISISSTVLQFEYAGFAINLLDTPGHKDFSEDTYRVLTAVDSVVMVIDSAKGIEPQTRKLFEVCRQRGVPIFTFMNKCDRPMKNPLELVDELERVLGIGAFPVNWPIGNGFEFQGVYDRQAKQFHLFERTVGGKHRAPVSVGGIEIAPENPAFSGFIFKIQANMDPKHRDRIAFIRVCSGKFERDMVVHHSRSERKVRLSSSHKIFGNERETVNEAFPGDVIGLVGHDSFGIGDTLTTDPKILYKEIPRFTPEAFAYLHNPNTAKFKQFRQGLDQLLQEGVIQALYLRDSMQKIPLLAAVGPLQFEVVQYRLESEYGAVSRLESAPWSVVRWLPTDITEEQLDALSLPTGAKIAYDMGRNAVVLFQNDWSANYFSETNKGIVLSALPVQTAKE
jgi:peptide chain release factor 3